MLMVEYKHTERSNQVILGDLNKNGIHRKLF